MHLEKNYGRALDPTLVKFKIVALIFFRINTLRIAPRFFAIFNGFIHGRDRGLPGMAKPFLTTETHGGTEETCTSIESNKASSMNDSLIEEELRLNDSLTCD